MDTHNRFVGRRQELAALFARLDLAGGGQGGIALLAGEAGIGKTRLLTELATEARGRGWLAFAGRAFESEGLPPYAPLAEALRDYVRHCPLDTLREQLGDSILDVALVAPDLRRRLPEGAARSRLTTSLPTAGGPQSAFERYRVFEGVSDFLLSVAGVGGRRSGVEDDRAANDSARTPRSVPSQTERTALVTSPSGDNNLGDTSGSTPHTRPPTPSSGLLLILDDLHWADVSTLLLVEHLVRRAAGAKARLLVAGAYRPAGLGHDHPLASLLAALNRERLLQRLPVAPLAVADAAALVSGLSDRAITPAVVERVVRQAEGNPFFLEEIVRHLQFDAPEPGADTDWGVPEGVRELIDRRLLRLSGAAQQLLQAGAVLGDGFGFDLLGDMTGIEVGVLLDALEETLGAGLVREESGGYHFTHALIRETLIRQLSLPRRQRLHLQAAHALEQLGAPNAGSLAALAAHYRLAGAAAGDAALISARHAAAAADAAYAWEDAAEHWQTAVELTPSHDWEARGELLLRTGGALRRAGELAAAREQFLAAAELGRGSMTSAERDAKGHLLADAALGFAGEWIRDLRGDPLVVALLEEALAVLGEEESSRRVRIVARLAAELYLRTPLSRVMELGQDAVALARRLGDPTALACALSSLHLALSAPAQLQERLAVGQEMVELSKALGDRETELLGHRWLVQDLLESGDGEASDREDAAYSRVAGELRQPFLRWRSLARRALRSRMAGRLMEADRLAREARALGQGTDPEEVTAIYGALASEVRREQMRLEERMLLAWNGAIATYPNYSPFRCWRLRLCVDLGRAREAREQFEELASNGFADLRQDIDWLTCLAILGEAAVALEDRPHAAMLHELLTPYASHCVIALSGSAWLGSVAQYLGLLGGLLERWEEAERYFEQAAEVHARMDAAAFVAETRLAHARLLLARARPEDRPRGLVLLAEAGALAERLGLVRLAAAVARVRETEPGPQPRAEAARTPHSLATSLRSVGSLLSPESSVPSPRSVLSPREQEVLRLLAGGLTNRAIAAELVVAPGTVHRHLENIYAKIGVRNRAAAAAYALAHGLRREA